MAVWCEEPAFVFFAAVMLCVCVYVLAALLLVFAMGTYQSTIRSSSRYYSLSSCARHAKDL